MTRKISHEFLVESYYCYKKKRIFKFIFIHRKIILKFFFFYEIVIIQNFLTKTIL